MSALRRVLRATASWGVLGLLLSASVPAIQGCGGGGSDSGCCKTCTEGKACGDSCIAVNLTCNSPSGCACNN